MSCLLHERHAGASRRRARSGSSSRARRRGSCAPRPTRGAAPCARRARAGRCAPRARRWSVGGSAASPCSAWAATSCSRNSGLPSAVSTILPASCDSSARRRRRGAAPARPGAPRARAATAAAAAPPTTGGSPAAPGGRCRRAGSARRSRTRPRARAGRAASGSAQCTSSRTTIERTGARDLLEQPAHGPRRLLGLDRLPGEPDRAEHLARDRRGLLVAAHDLHEPRLGVAPAELPDDLGERAEGDALAVGRAAPDDGGRRVAVAAISSRTSRDLPIPGVPSSVTSSAARRRASRASSAERSAVELRRPPDERRRRDLPLARVRGRQLPGRAAASAGDRRDRERLRPDEPLGEPAGQLAEQDLAGAGGLLQALRAVDRVAAWRTARGARRRRRTPRPS